MAQEVLTQVNRDACLVDMTTAFGATSKLALFTNQPSMVPGRVLADFTLATFTGSAPKTIAVWSAPYTDPLTGRRVVTGNGGAFVATAVPASETIYGYVVTDMAGAVLEYAAYLANPIAIANVGEGLNVDATIPYGS